MSNYFILKLPSEIKSILKGKNFLPLKSRQLFRTALVCKESRQEVKQCRPLVNMPKKIYKVYIVSLILLGKSGLLVLSYVMN